MKQQITKCLIVALCAIFSYVLPFHIFDTQSNINFAQHGSYWVLTILLISFLYYLSKSLKPQISWLEGLKKHKIGVIIILLCSVFLHVHEKREFKILFDEFSINGTAMNLHFYREADNPTLVHRIDDRMVVMESFVDKRPVFFPYILSLVHSLTGYRVSNVFWLNTLLTITFLSLLYTTVSEMTNQRYGIFSVLTICTLPLLAQSVNSGGYEIMNLNFILILLLTSINYLKKQGTQGLDLMILSALILSNIRYESILYLLVPVGLFVIKNFREKKIELTWFSSITPLFLILPLTFNRVFYSNKLFFDNHKEGFFSMSHIGKNMSEAIVYMYDYSGLHSNSLWISILGPIATVFFVVFVIRNIKKLLTENNDLTAVTAIFTITGTLTILALSNFWGSWTDPVTTRFSLPLHLLFTISIPVVLYFGFKIKAIKLAVLLIPICIALFFSSAAFARADNNPQLITKNGYSWLIENIHEIANKNNALIITETPSPFILYGYASARTAFFNACPEKYLQMRNLGLYQNIFVIQKIKLDPNGQETDVSVQTINPDCILSPITELQIRHNYIYRISKLEGVKGIDTNSYHLKNSSITEYSDDNFDAYIFKLFFQTNFF